MAKISVVLFTSKKYNDGTSPIMLRLTKNQQLKYFKIGYEKFNILSKQWDKEFGLVKADKRLNPEHTLINNYIKKKHSQALKILESFEEKGVAWTFNMFEEEYRNKPKINKVKPFIEARINELQNQGKYNSSTGLKETLVILEKFYPNLQKLYFQDIDFKFIEGFYFYLKNERGNKDTTIGIMLRGIRAILNEAINRGVGSKEAYPFSKIYGATKTFKISKLEKSSTKKYIPREYMLRLVNSEILESHLNWAKQMFLFSFFASGINFKDMAHLKEENIISRTLVEGKEYSFIEFKRLKTNEAISIPITESLKQILQWSRANTTNKNGYLLPIISNTKLTGEKLNEHITHRRKRFNKYLKKIAEKLEFPDGLLHISSYFARHSYATTLLRNGAQIEKISEALGHTNIKTTQTYLESFGIDEIAKMNEDLLRIKIVRVLDLTDSDGVYLLKSEKASQTMKEAIFYLDKKTSGLPDDKFIEWLKDKAHNGSFGYEDRVTLTNDVYTPEFAFMSKDIDKLGGNISMVIDMLAIENFLVARTKPN